MEQMDNDEVRRVSSLRRAAPQILATLAKNTLGMNFGLCMGFPAILLPVLKNETELNVTKEQISWISSLFFICVPIGSLGSGCLIQLYGRKAPMLMLCIPFALSWLLYARATNVWFLFGAVTIQGLITGLFEAPIITSAGCARMELDFGRSSSFICNSMFKDGSSKSKVNTYVAEISEPNLRGCLSITGPLAFVIGVFLQFFIANYLPWRDCAYVNISFPVLSIICISLIPESPYWLIGRGYNERAGKSLMWLRGWTTLPAVRAELDDLILYIHEDRKDAPFTWKNIWNTKFIKPFLLISVTFAIGHFSGMATLQTFSIEIFEYLHTPIESYKAAAIVGFVQLAGTLLCICIISFVKRRQFTLVCSIAIGICFTSLVVFDQGWPAFLLVLTSVFFLNTCGRVTSWVLLGEVFPPDSRSVATGLSSSMAYFINFIAHKTFGNIVDLLSLKSVLILYGFVSFLGTIFYYFFLPETEGKSLQEIQNYFKKRNNHQSSGEEERDSFIEGIN